MIVCIMDSMLSGSFGRYYGSWCHVYVKSVPNMGCGVGGNSMWSIASAQKCSMCCCMDTVDRMMNCWKHVSSSEAEALHGCWFCKKQYAMTNSPCGLVLQKLCMDCWGGKSNAMISDVASWSDIRTSEFAELNQPILSSGHWARLQCQSNQAWRM